MCLRAAAWVSKGPSPRTSPEVRRPLYSPRSWSQSVIGWLISCHCEDAPVFDSAAHFAVRAKGKIPKGSAISSDAVPALPHAAVPLPLR